MLSFKVVCCALLFFLIGSNLPQVAECSDFEKNGKPCVAYNGKPGTCDFHGYDYVWCYTAGGGWDYCSIYQGNYLTENGKPCVAYKRISACGYHDENYVWCYTTARGDWEKCSDNIDTILYRFPNLPIIVKERRGLTETLLFPKKDTNGITTLSCASETNLFFACSGKANTFTSTSEKTIQAKCIKGKLRLNNNQETSLDYLGCKQKVSSTIKYTGVTCGAGDAGHLYQIGFGLESHDNPHLFYSLIDVCYKKKPSTTLWTRHIIHGSDLATAASTPSEEVHFKQGREHLLPANMELIYNSQGKVLNTLLNKGFINRDKCQYFAKGHLSPAGDFVTEAEVAATYHYINALPQWQTINNGNWKNIVENSVRELAKARGTDMLIITGGFNIMELPDGNTPPTRHQLFLYNPNRKRTATTAFGPRATDPDEQAVPVPLLTWKVVKEISTNNAVAFVVNNNPDAPHTPLCTNICDKSNPSNDLIPWLADRKPGSTLDRTSQVKGFIYCCTVESLRDAILNIPDIGHTGVLTG